MNKIKSVKNNRFRYKEQLRELETRQLLKSAMIQPRPVRNIYKKDE